MVFARTAKLRWLTVAVVSATAIFGFALLTNSLAPSTSAIAQSTDDGAARVALNNQYLKEADALFGQKFAEEKKIADYEKEKSSASSEQLRQELNAKIQESKDKIDQIQKQINASEKLNQALFAMDPALKEKIYSIQRALFDKYVMKDSTTYVGENPVEAVEAELLIRSISISVNPEKVAPDGSNIPAEKNIDGIPILIKYSKFELTGCTPYSHTGTCRPVVGGVSTSVKETLSLNTVGYKATWNGYVGYVTAGHTAQGVGKILVQPHNDPAKRVGVVPSGFPTAICQPQPTCDFAFVKADSGIAVDDDIFPSPSNILWDIDSKRADSGQLEGTYVAKSGAGTSYTSGNVVENNGNFNYNRASFNGGNGDSGSPVYQPHGFALAELFGEMYAINGSNNSYYYPQDFIQTVIGATASTT